MSITTNPELRLPPLRTFIVRRFDGKRSDEIMVEAHTVSSSIGGLEFSCYSTIDLGEGPQLMLYTRRGFHEWVDFEEVVTSVRQSSRVN